WPYLGKDGDRILGPSWLPGQPVQPAGRFARRLSAIEVPIMRHAAAAALLFALLSGPALAHGGQYKGPSDAGGPSGAGGGAAAPPTNPGGAAAPGPGAPSAGAPSTGPGPTGGGRQHAAPSTGPAIDISESY